ncbi:WcaI family glycosyltransferase [Rufibacter hautae]|uniref:WcaI family glycosyltransferase n=1 Tax=Rufibacter hautae TaxID=2595005 RepID=A0A5B6TGT0_9BACT|nr:WcaI family glycosyltransferase [Rufibacter hautae]KAA3439601.1 WcaI family glycosyltransferase [Rufibacter hautae]
MKKRILLISYNFKPEPTGIGKYCGEQIHWLANRGYDCTVVTTYPYYPYWKVQEPYYHKRFRFSSEVQQFESGGKIRTLRCPIYVPANPSGLKRIILDFTFLLSAGLRVLGLVFSQKFDVVITVAPSFLIGFLGVLYKGLRGAKLLYHIQDLQIEAARDLQMIQNKRVIEILFKLEKAIFNRSDVVSSISESMVDRIQSKAEKHVFLHPNWTDTSQFYPIKDQESLKELFGFKSTDKVILYSGAIGEKQGLEAIIQAADRFRNQENWKFVICGSGPYKARLIDLAERLDLQNLIFFPLQPFEKFNQFLNMADLHLVIQKGIASDLVMPSKLTTILAVGGLALITANPGTGLYALVHKHNMGILVEAENQEALNTGIWNALVGASNESIKSAACAYAEKYLSIESIMQSFEEHVFSTSMNSMLKGADKLARNEKDFVEVNG